LIHLHPQVQAQTPKGIRGNRDVPEHVLDNQTLQGSRCSVHHPTLVVNVKGSFEDSTGTDTYEKVIKIPLFSGSMVFSMGALTLSKVMNAAAEYIVWMRSVSTPSPRSIRMTVSPF
jgi:hypothetical protein